MAAHRAVKDLLKTSKVAAQNADLKAVIEKALKTRGTARNLNTMLRIADLFAAGREG